MRRILLFFVIITSVSTGIVRGQKSANNTSLVLEKLYTRLVNNNNDSIRIQVNDSIIQIIDSYVTSDTVFVHKFKNLQYLGQITSPDSSLKIITWNLILPDSQNRYFCYFIMKQDQGKKNIVYKLSASYKEETIISDTIYTEKDWYGALYYDVRPYLIGGKKCWLLLGIDYGNPDITRKVIDVLDIAPDNSILFGRKWFESEGNLRFREVFEYTSNGMMSLRFQSDSTVVFDHLAPFSEYRKDDHRFYGPDYSYDAYSFIKGLWKLLLNVDARNKE